MLSFLPPIVALAAAGGLTCAWALQKDASRRTVTVMVNFIVLA